MLMISAQIIEHLIFYRYAILFPTLVFEGPVATVVGGFLASPEKQIFNIYYLFIFVVVADVFGDFFYYIVGRYGGRRIVLWLEDKLSKKGIIEIEKEDYLDRIARYFAQHGGITLALAKVSHGLGWPIMVGAGSVKMPLKRFFLFCVPVSIVKSGVLLLIGYYVGKDYEKITMYFGQYAVVVSAILIIVILYFIKSNNSKV